MKISVVIPVYRNQGTISRTFESIASVFVARLSAYECEVVCVDDGSDDESLAEILELRARDKRVKAITFTRNFGQMAAILAGLKEVTGDAVIIISADLQDPVELIPQMVEKWREGAEVVVCHRRDRVDTISTRIFSRIAYGVLRLSVPQIPAGGFDFVLIDRAPLTVFNSIDIRNRFFQGDLLWTGHRTSFIPYVRLKRPIGRSQYNFRKKLKIFLDACLDASYLPIRLVMLLGLLTSLLGVLYSVSIVAAWRAGAAPFTGWASIMVAILLLGGLIMVMLGVIGEYVWRIYDEVRRKPNYVIREKHL